MPKRLTFPNVSSRFGSSGLGATSMVQPTTQIPSTFTDNLPLPKLFVFDIDYTLWPFWVDTHVSSPVKPASKDPNTNTAMLDRYGESFSFYSEVPGILWAARQRGITMALASRTHAPDLAEKMMKGIMVPVPKEEEEQENKVDESADTAPTTASPIPTSKEKAKPTRSWDFFTYREIFPGSKIKHFNKIQASTRSKRHHLLQGRGANEGEEIAFADMIFFDDEGRNREVETQLGVTFVLVRDGVTRDEVDRGVREWRKRRGFSALSGRDGKEANGDDDGGNESGEEQREENGARSEL